MFSSVFTYSVLKNTVNKQEIFEKFAQLYFNIQYQNIQFSNRKYMRNMQCLFKYSLSKY